MIALFGWCLVLFLGEHGEILLRAASRIDSYLVSPDHSWLLMETDAKISLWDTKKKNCVWTDRDARPSLPLSFKFGDKVFAIGSVAPLGDISKRSRVEVRKIPSGDLVWTQDYKGHSLPTMAFSVDQTRLFLCDIAGKLSVVSVIDGRLICVFDTSLRMVKGIAPLSDSGTSYLIWSRAGAARPLYIDANGQIAIGDAINLGMTTTSLAIDTKQKQIACSDQSSLSVFRYEVKDKSTTIQAVRQRQPLPDRVLNMAYSKSKGVLNLYGETEFFEVDCLNWKTRTIVKIDRGHYSLPQSFHDAEGSFLFSSKSEIRLVSVGR